LSGPPRPPPTTPDCKTLPARPPLSGGSRSRGTNPYNLRTLSIPARALHTSATQRIHSTCFFAVVKNKRTRLVYHALNTNSLKLLLRCCKKLAGTSITLCTGYGPLVRPSTSPTTPTTAAPPRPRLAQAAADGAGRSENEPSRAGITKAMYNPPRTTARRFRTSPYFAITVTGTLPVE